MSEKRKDKRGRILKDGESQRSDGRYMYRYVDADGNRRTIYSWLLFSSDKLPDGKRPCTPLRELEKQLKKEMSRGIMAPKRGVTLDEQVDKYLKLKRNLRVTTRMQYDMVYDQNVRGGFGKREIADIKYSDVKLFYLYLYNDKGLKINSINNVNTVISPALKMAVRDGLIRSNPAEGVLGELKAEVNAPKVKRSGLTIPQQTMFIRNLETIPDKHTRNLFIVMLGTGCRVGEISGLCWEDCDFENNEITISRTVGFFKADKSAKWDYHISDPKTNAGFRKVPMVKEVREALLSEKGIWREPKEVEGVSNFVFSTIRGTPVRATNLDIKLRNLVEKFNSDEERLAELEGRQPVMLPHITVHNLRHTFCMRLCENENNLKVIQEIMGHANISVTMDVYNEVTKEKLKETFESLEGKLGLS